MRIDEFFYLTLSHEDMTNFYKTNFTLHQHYNWSIDEIEGMYPFERIVYIELLNQYLEEKRQREQASNPFNM